MRILASDVDDTISSSRERKYRIIRALSGGRYSREYCSSHSTMGREFGPDFPYSKFWEMFDSPDYLKYDEPVPGSAEASNILAVEYGISWLTNRHRGGENSMEQATLDWMREKGFPYPELVASSPSGLLVPRISLFMKEDREIPTEEFKMHVLEGLKEQHEIVAGIGDLPTDADAYLQAGIRAMALIRRWRNSPEDYPAGCEIFDSWKEIAEALL